MNQSLNFESYRYPKEVLIAQITKGLAWLMWAIIGVLLVAGTLATNGLALLITLTLVIGISGLIIWKSLWIIQRSVRVSDQNFPNFYEFIRKWRVRASDPYPSDILLTGSACAKVFLIPVLKRPAVVFTHGALEALASSGTSTELEFTVYQTLAQARLNEHYEWLFFLPLYLSFPLVLLPLWLKRLRAASADRIACNLTAARNAEFALLLLSLGPTIAPKLHAKGTQAKIGESQLPSWLAQTLVLFSSTPLLNTRLSLLKAM